MNRRPSEAPFKSTSLPPWPPPARLQGRLEVGSDADILLLDKVTLNLKYVWARGVLLKAPGWTQAGMCEKKSKKLRPHDQRGQPP